jgi:hypothetical protein
VNKNWPNDSMVGCNSFSSLVELIEANSNLGKELEKFEGMFQKDEILEI